MTMQILEYVRHIDNGKEMCRLNNFPFNIMAYPASKGKPPDFFMTALFLSDLDKDHKAKALPRATLTGRGRSSSAVYSKFPNYR